MIRNYLIPILTWCFIFGVGIFAGRIGDRNIYTFPITVYAPHTPDTIPMGLTLNGTEVHCFFVD